MDGPHACSPSYGKAKQGRGSEKGDEIPACGETADEITSLADSTAVTTYAPPEQQASSASRPRRAAKVPKSDTAEPNPKRPQRKATTRKASRSKATGSASDDPDVQKLLALDDVDKDVKDFEKQAEVWTRHFRITKCGQGSYAAIFRLQLLSAPASASSDLLSYTMWKLMALKTSKSLKCSIDDATFVDDAIMEVKTLAAMSRSKGFVEFRSACVLRGALPEVFQRASEEWTRSHDGEDEVGEYSADQLWLFIEMTDAGPDLECILNGRPCLRFSDDIQTDGHERQNIMPTQAWDIFWGVVEALAHGEDHVEFEHRDLHPGNICVKAIDASEPPPEDQPGPWVKLTSLEVTLIDYTLSRAKLDSGEVLANPMRDKTVFAQTSDIEPDRAQYELYRKMRKVVVGKSINRGPKAEAERWRASRPVTNVMWLGHLLDILLEHTLSYSMEQFLGPITEPPEDGTDFFQGMAHLMLLHLQNDLRAEDVNGWIFQSAKSLWLDTSYQAERGSETTVRGCRSAA